MTSPKALNRGLTVGANWDATLVSIRDLSTTQMTQVRVDRMRVNTHQVLQVRENLVPKAAQKTIS